MGVLMSAASGFSLETLLSYASSLLTWVLTSMTSVFNFFLSNPGLMIWFILGIVGLVFVYVRQLF